MQFQSSTIFVCLLVLASTVGTSAWDWGFYGHPAYPGKCFINDHLILSPGDEVKNPDDCARISCASDEGHARVITCGAESPPPNCHWDGYVNVNDFYPKCCKQKLKCDSPKDLENGKRMFPIYQH